MDDLNSKSCCKSCCLCHRHVQECLKGWHCQFAKVVQGLFGVVSTLVQFCGILAIRDTRRMKFCQKQTNVDAADTNWDFNCRVNTSKSLYAQ